MDENGTEGFVARGLRSLGLQVRWVEEGSTKTPDLILFDGTQTYVLEVKDKFPDPRRVSGRGEALRQGEVWEQSTRLAYSNAVSRIIRKAADQLSAFQPEQVDFRLIWLHARDRYEDVQLTQFQATLYGAVDLIDLDEMASPVPARPCFYFSFSEFFKLSAVLDGAFVSTDDRGLLCLNTLSPRYQALRNSGLCGAFPGVCDPVKSERSSEAYIADCDITRTNRAAVLKFVQEKYRRPRLLEFTPTHYSAEDVVPSRKL